jgi:predicted metal-dependent HD superfamily phosphohydrolase
MNNYLELAKTIYPINNHYHSFNHIKNMINIFELYKEQFKNEGMNCTEKDMYLAIVYHDAVYIPGSFTNEYDSVKFMQRFGIMSSTIENLIMSTVVDEEHINNWKNYSINCKIMHDLDWFGFSISTGIYEQNMSIISEVEHYCRNKFSRKEIIDARMNFLKSLFDKDIFYTKTLEHLNNKAKENIKKYYENCKQFI